MSEGAQTGGSFEKIRANRKVLERNCGTCGNPFVFGEEVTSCGVCGTFHHAACWDRAGGCRHDAAAAYPSETVAETPGGVAPSTQPPPLPPPPVSQVRALGPDEQYCSQCREIIKAGALKCRFCGYAFDTRLNANDIPTYIAGEVESQANTAMWCGICGFLICGPIFGTIAIVKGSSALRTMDQYPNYMGPRGKARAGQVMGIIQWSLVALWIIIAIVNSTSR
jgi:hypothetical protein